MYMYIFIHKHARLGGSGGIFPQETKLISSEFESVETNRENLSRETATKKSTYVTMINQYSIIELFR